MNVQKNSGVITAGLALFSMFFGAGDLLWPIILGGNSGDQNFYAMCGLLVTGVSLPLLGVISMILFGGDYREFFGRIGKYPSIVLLFVIQAILGPFGSIPRLITLMHATIEPYMPFNLSLVVFSFLASILILACTFKPSKIIDLLGYILTPVLLACLGGILILGFWNHPEPAATDLTSSAAFKEGLATGYNTLDLIASFIFAPFVLFHFCQDRKQLDNPEMMSLVFKKMLKASFIAAGLLSAMYVGLTYVSSFYTPIIGDVVAEGRLSAVAIYLLGPYGGFVSCMAVFMACLTTAIPIVSICAEYVKESFLNEKVGTIFPQVLILLISGCLANLGFIGIANMLTPILEVLCPALIVLSVMNIFHKLYEFKPVKVAFGSTLGLTAISRYLSQ